MPSRLITLTIAFCLFGSALPASAESVRVRASESVHVESNENGTVTKTSEERVIEERSDDDSTSVRTSVQSTSDEESNDNGTVKTEYFRACVNDECVEQTTDSDGKTTVRSNVSADNTWWQPWNDRILNTLRVNRTEVASAEDEDTAETTALERMQARLARRVCLWFADERDGCLEDAAEGGSLTMRERLRSWIDRL